MSVGENISFGLRMAPKGEREDAREIARRVDEAAEMLGLTGELAKKPKELSGGQRQRVAIGRALVRRPEGLLMDEPLSNMDAKLRGQMRIELRRLHETHGTTTTYVTHDQVEAMTLTDRIAIMNRAKLQQHAAPLEAYANPSNPFVATFLGTPPMNLIPGEASAGRFKCQGLDFELPEHLRSWEGPCAFGIRPEELLIDETGTEAEILGIERLGANRFITCGSRISNSKPCGAASHNNRCESASNRQLRGCSRVDLV